MSIETKTTQERIAQLAALNNSTNQYLSDQLMKRYGTTRRSEIIAKIGDNGQPFEELLNNSLFAFTYLLRDDFTTDESAPLDSPRTAEPGPGTLTITDTENKLSISGGKLAFASGKASPAYGDPAAWGGVRARAAGRAVLVGLALTQANKFVRFGWSAAASGTPQDTILFTQSTAKFKTLDNASVGPDLDTYIETSYQMAMVLRAAGGFALVKGGTFSSWAVLWVAAASTTATVYPVLSGYDATFTADNFRVLDLPAPFDTDYGLAMQRLAGARSAGDTFTHEANCIVEFTVTTLPSASVGVLDFRMQDTDNCWRLKWTNAGRIALNEVIGSVETLRGAVDGVVANGDRIVVIADGTTIRVYEANTLRITYASAANFATSTAGLLSALGTGGAVSDLVSWPRVLTGIASSLLDQASV